MKPSELESFGFRISVPLMFVRFRREMMSALPQFSVFVFHSPFHSPRPSVGDKRECGVGRQNCQQQTSNSFQNNLLERLI